MACLSLLALSGCSDEDIEITSASVEGTSAASDGVVPINKDFNEGRFRVSWSVSIDSGELFESDDTKYAVRLYLSDDDEVSTSTDVEFYEADCDEFASADNCPEDGSIGCNFTSEIEIVCDTSETDISDWLDQLTKDAHILIEACVEDGDPCDTASVRVGLQ